MHLQAGLADDLVGIVEFGRLRKMGDVAGMDHESGLDGHCLHLGDRLLQRAERVRIGGLVEADMAVADLEEGETFRVGGERFADEPERLRHPAGKRPQDAGAGPDHALESASAVDLGAVIHKAFVCHRTLLCAGVEISLLWWRPIAEPQYSRQFGQGPLGVKNDCGRRP